MSSEIFSPLKNREPISKIIASQIEEAILEKKYLPGSKLPSEAELCEQFNVSRTPLREALQFLSAQGLISIQKGKGVFVNNLSSLMVTGSLTKYLRHKLDKDYAIDIVQARQILEPSIAYSASLNRTEEDLEKIGTNIEEHEKCEEINELLSKYDMEFHLLLAKATHNKVIPLLLKSLYNLLPEISPAVYALNKGAKGSAIQLHKEIFECIKNRDGGGATLKMSEHLTNAEKDTREMLEIQANFEKK